MQNDRNIKMMNSNNIVVVHNETSCEFFVDLSSLGLEDGRAILKYRKDSENSVDFYQTFVPRFARGRGIAEALVEQGLAWATQKGYTQNASCWYVQKHLSS
jgi:hypothetical protein